MAEEKKNIKFGQIGNALRSAASDHVTAVASDIFDEDSQKYQNAINAELDTSIKSEAQARTENDALLSSAISEERDRAMAAEEANTQAIVKRGIYDVSAQNNGAVFESLSALLNNANLSTLIPTSVRCGGMSIRFIQSVPNSDNKYVQFRLMTQNFTTDVTQWQGVDDEPTAGSSNLVESGGVYERLKNIAKKSGSTDNYENKYYKDSFTEDGYCNALDQQWNVDSRYKSTPFIECSSDTVTSIKAKALFGDDSAAGLVFYNSSKEVIGTVYNQIGGLMSEKTITEIPEGTKYVRCTEFNTPDAYLYINEVFYGELKEDIDSETERATEAEIGLEKAISAEKTRAVDIEDELEDKIEDIYIDKTVEEVIEHDSTTWSINNTFIIASNGKTGNGNGYSCTDFIKIPDNVQSIVAMALFGDAYEAGIAFYREQDVNTHISSISGVTSTWIEEYIINKGIIPSLAKYIRLSYYPKNGASTPVPYVKFNVASEIKGGKLRITDSVAVGTSPNHVEKASFVSSEILSLGESMAKIFKQMSFFGIIESFGGKLSFYHGENLYDTGYIEIDDTNIKIYNRDSTIHERVNTPHGLAITDYIGVIAKCNDVCNLDVTIVTNGGSFTVSNPYWWASQGEIKVVNTNCSLSDVSFSYNVDGYKQKTWLFGDSYIDFKDANRWPTWMRTWGFVNLGAFGFPGADSSEVYPEWHRCLSHGTPKYAIWCMGMNDTEDNAMNSSWLSCVQNFLAVCEQKGIIPILATIPNTPLRDNTYKNNWVKASGYRYIDFAEAVGSYNDSGWYYDMLSQDNVHPAQQGAIALAMRAISDVPELIQD